MTSMREGDRAAGSTVAAPMRCTTTQPPSVMGDVGKATSFVDASFFARLVPPSRRGGSAARAPPFPAPTDSVSGVDLPPRSGRTSAEAEHIVPVTWLVHKQAKSSRTIRSPSACSRSSSTWPTSPVMPDFAGLTRHARTLLFPCTTCRPQQKKLRTRRCWLQLRGSARRCGRGTPQQFGVSSCSRKRRRCSLAQCSCRPVRSRRGTSSF